MLDRLKAWLTEGDQRTTEGAEEVRLAVAALLMEAALVDGDLDPAERGAVRGILQQHFALGDGAASALAQAGERQAEQETQLFGITRFIRERFPLARRIEVIEMLWEVVYANGVLDPLEDTLVRRVGGLIDVSDHERGEARIRVMRRLGIPAG